MNTILDAESRKPLGWIDAVVGAAGSITSSAINARTQVKANEAMTKQAEQALLLTKTQHQQDLEKIETISKAVLLIGGAAIVALIAWKFSQKKTVGAKPLNGKVRALRLRNGKRERIAVGGYK